jgi:putative ABC transport system permease protein
VAIRPIVSALKRNRMGAALVVVQVALTLAILSNVLSVVVDRASLVLRPTGMQEDGLFALGYRYTNDDGTLPSVARDLAALRGTPGVVDAVATNSYPLHGGGWAEGIGLAPGEAAAKASQGYGKIYAMDGHGIPTLGLRLIAGRNFTANDVFDGAYNRGPLPPVAIITSFLAHRLYGDQAAVGKTLYLASDPTKPIAVIGVIVRLQTPAAAESVDPATAEASILLPVRAAGVGGAYLIRAHPDALDATMAAAKASLVHANANRIFGRLRPFAEIRATAYAKDRGLAIAMAIVTAVLVVITALGIIGLTSFWVVRRRGQVGLRRALGATRAAIVGYFLTENALLCCTGVVAGAIASFGLNAWLWTRYGVDRLPGPQVLGCCLLVVVVGQLAALWPAIKAARLAPIEALRAGP